MAQSDKHKDTVTFIPVNEQLKELGVETFVRQSNVININFKNGPMVVVQIDPKKLTNTRDAFEKEALRYPDFSRDTVNKVLLFLMDASNGYLQYLLYNKGEELNGKSDKESFRLQTLSGKGAAARLAIKLAKKYCQDFFVDLGQPYAAVRIDKHLEVLPIKGSTFKNLLCEIFYKYTSERLREASNKEGQSKKNHSVEDVENEAKQETEEEEDTSDILTTENLNNVLRVLEAKATFSKNPPKELHLRVAKHDNGNSILYDLTNPEWQVVRVTERGWDIEYAPVVFRRYSNQIPQAYPSKEYPPDIFDRFIDLLNIKDQEDNRLLFKVYIIVVFYPGIQHPALMLYGEKGTAKSTLQELVKMLVDPSAIKTLAFSRNIESMIQKLAHNYICYFDNVSKISESISDILCRAVTGSGFLKRELFTDDDDVIYNFKRCIGINGINLGATKSDLVDRGLIIEHTPIPRYKKRLLKEIWQNFYQIRHQLLGYIFDILTKVLEFQKQNPDGLKLTEYPRLADFAENGEIISRCIGNKPGKFIEAYFRNIDRQTRDIVENDVVGKAIEIFIDSRMPPLWNGTITELLDSLTKIAQDNLKIRTSNGKLWPQAPNSLSRRINLIKADLRNIGILVEKDSLDKSDRQWTIRRYVTNEDNDNGIIIAPRNNVLYQQAIVRKQNYTKIEHISPEQPYRLKPVDCAQVSIDNSHNAPGDITFDVNHVSPCISSEENGKNSAQNTYVRRSGDSGDICSPSLQNHNHHQTELPKDLQVWCGTISSNTGIIVPKSTYQPEVEKILGNYLAFDFEWDINTHVIEAASFVDSTGNSIVLLRSDFQNSEKRLLLHISSKLIDYEWSMGWNSTGHVNNPRSVEMSDLSILHKRCIANNLESIVSLGQKGVPYIKGRKHIDLCNVYRKMMVQVTIYNNSYRTHKLEEVSKVLLGHGKYKNFSGLDFKNLPIEEQIEYSLRDSELVMQLSKHENCEVLDALYAVSEITELDYEQVCRTNLSTWWGAIFNKMVKNRECKPPVKTSFSGTYKGAEVIEPKKGFYHNVVVVDATSLYPSVGINYNLSFDTINCKCCKDYPKPKISATIDDKFLKDCKFVKRDSWICKKEIGAFPRKLRLFKSERLKQKDLGNKPKQLALKILINGGYGVFGDDRYEYYDPRVAELVTALGRQALSKMQSIAKDLAFKIIYGDTDSLFLDNPNAESLSRFQDRFNRELGIELGIKNTYFNCILSKGKKHYIGYGLNDKNKEAFDIVGMEGKKNDRPQFVNNVFNQLVKDVVIHNVDPVPNLRCAMSDLESKKLDADLLKITKVLGDNPEDYRSQTCQSAMIGKALNVKKGESIEYFVSDKKKTGSSWSINPSDIDTKWYKQSLWKTVSEVLEIAGYPIEDLSKEFGVINRNRIRTKKKHGHSDAEPPSGVTGIF